MSEKIKKIPFIILFLVFVLIIHKLAGEAFTVAFLTVVLLGIIYSKQANINKFIQGVIKSG
jgi:hypothetical protein